MEPRSFGECDGILIQHYLHDDLGGWKSENTDSIAVLTHGFFRYFAREFPWDTHFVSVTKRQVRHMSALGPLISGMQI